MLPNTERPVNLAYTGALIRVQLGVPAYAPIDTVGLIDTGASCSIIHTELAKQLKLVPAGTMRIRLANNIAFECPKYRIRLQFPQRVYVDVVAGSTTWERNDYSCLIGRDALKHGVLIYNGLTSTFSFVF